MLMRHSMIRQAFEGRYRKDFLAVSHRWVDPDSPDSEDGTQFKKVRKHLLEDPNGKKIKWVWYDFWCM